MKTKTDVAITDFEILDWGEIFGRGMIQYCIMGEEICPDTERRHYQGFLQFKHETTLRDFKNMISKKTHIEWRVGTVEQNINYCKGLCKKKDFKENKWEEWGRPSLGKQGMRTDLLAISDDIKQGCSLTEIAAEYPSQWIRYNSGIKSLWHETYIKTVPKWRDVTVTVFCGESDSGKTSRCVENECFIIDMEQKSEFLFNGYMGEKTILFDEFYGQIKYSYMLRLLDGHQVPLNIKNGQTKAGWDTVFITSNKTPALWYVGGLRSLKRRISNIYEVRKGNTELFSLDHNSKKNYEIIESESEDSESD